MRLTYVGSATTMIKVAGLRIVTDPVLDPAGSRSRYRAGARCGSRGGVAMAHDRSLQVMARAVARACGAAKASLLVSDLVGGC